MSENKQHRPQDGKKVNKGKTAVSSSKKRAWRPWRRWTHAHIDLGNPRHRRRLLALFVIINIFVAAFLFANYKIYNYAESAEFCGTACHTMAPEMARYEESPHSNVECVECHIGPGATSLIKSKIDGMKQVYALATNSYSRPIVGPVHNLRPARETCETCHNPTQFKDNVIKTIRHYDNDEANTAVQSTLILKMGGWQESTGMSQGIHWHITNPVYYIAADEQRQVILWVGAEQDDGSMKEYFARDMLAMAQTAFVDNAFENDDVRLMDCIDCHNRAAHYIPPPQEAVDDAIEHGLIDQNIPFIRAKAIETLLPAYNSTAEAYAAIDGLVDFYQLGYQQDNLLLDPAIREIKNIYSETNFPIMAQNWETNPNNARHRPSLGCFRCHDDKHVTVNEAGQEMESISVKCNLCHTVPIVGRGDELVVESPVITGAAPETHADFRWTIEHRDVEDAEKQECYQCHGQAFCNNGVCHSLSHPPDMLFTHADEYYERGDQVCYTCHQNILCSRCHPGGIVSNP